MDLAAYRTDAETFLAEYGAAYHRHFAGLTEALPLDEIYARHGALFSPEAVARLRERAASASGEDDGRRLRMLLDFAVEGCLGLETKALDAELAQREASLRIDLGGASVGFREAAVVQANEPDASRRAALEAARLAATEEALNPLHREALEQTRALVARLGWPSYRAMCEELKGLDLAALARSTDAFAAATEDAYDAVVGPAVARTVGVPLDRLTRADLPWLFRFREADDHFPQERLMSSFVATLDGLGLDLAAQPNVDVDVEQRPGKSPRAFVVAVRVPQDVRLVVPPIGGRDDYTALLHEGGHLQHFASVDPRLPFEYRHLGDNAVSEAFAFLFDHLVENPEWLRRRLGVEDEDGALAEHARASRLVYLRRYGAKLSYELVAHGETPPADARLADAYARTLSTGVRVPWPSATYLSDLDPGFYVAAYLRAWALETHLRAWLVERFGIAWFAEPQAGTALRALWRDGQRLSAEELLSELTGARLDFGVLLSDLGLAEPPAA
ncbi:MAG: hypothetical protein JWQ48_61 [Conexibacter sp.]|nr:hypothetical protein [Conexibacter sp.]